MPANIEPIFTLTPQVASVAVGTANTARSAPGGGTVGTVLTAASNGTRIHRITIKATVTTTAGMVRLWIYTGTTYFLWREVIVAAITASATVAAFEVSIELFGERALILPAGYSLRATTEKSENFDVTAEGGDF